MSTFTMLTRLSHDGLKSPRALETLGKTLGQQIKAERPEVDWIASYAILGAADYVDIFSAPSLEAATKVSTIVRTFGHATTEVWGATPWKELLGMVRDLPPAEFLMESR